MSVLGINKKANYSYQLLENYETGLMLFGHEVKSVKSGQINLKGSYVSWRFKDNKTELYLIKAFIPPYKLAGELPDYNPERDRKLLLKKEEITKLIGKTQEAGLTLIPVKMYTKRGLVKLEIALAKGKKKADKRESIKKRELDRKIRTLTKGNFKGMSGFDS